MPTKSPVGTSANWQKQKKRPVGSDSSSGQDKFGRKKEPEHAQRKGVAAAAAAAASGGEAHAPADNAEDARPPSPYPFLPLYFLNAYDCGASLFNAAYISRGLSLGQRRKNETTSPDWDAEKFQKLYPEFEEVLFFDEDKNVRDGGDDALAGPDEDDFRDFFDKNDHLARPVVARSRDGPGMRYFGLCKPTSRKAPRYFPEPEIPRDGSKRLRMSRSVTPQSGGASSSDVANSETSPPSSANTLVVTEVNSAQLRKLFVIDSRLDSTLTGTIYSRICRNALNEAYVADAVNSTDALFFCASEKGVAEGIAVLKKLPKKAGWSLILFCCSVVLRRKSRRLFLCEILEALRKRSPALAAFSQRSPKARVELNATALAAFSQIYESVGFVCESKENRKLAISLDDFSYPNVDQEEGAYGDPCMEPDDHTLFDSTSQEVVFREGGNKTSATRLAFASAKPWMLIECLKIPGARNDMKTAGAFQTFRKIFRSLYTQNLLEPQTKYGTR